jgi:hypothetical protein
MHQINLAQSWMVKPQKVFTEERYKQSTKQHLQYVIRLKGWVTLLLHDNRPSFATIPQ